MNQFLVILFSWLNDVAVNFRYVSFSGLRDVAGTSTSTLGSVTEIIVPQYINACAYLQLH